MNEAPKKKPNLFLIFFGTIALCGIASLAGFSALANLNREPAQAGPKPTNTPGRFLYDPTAPPATGSEAGAWTACENFVEDRLKSPASADFIDESVVTRDLGNGRYLVRGSVDAENSLGATVRSDYRCEVEFDEGISYDLIDLEVTTP